MSSFANLGVSERLTLMDFLVQLPRLQSFSLFSSYLLIVCFARFYVRSTKPVDLSKVMLAYNSVCVIASVILTVRGTFTAFSLALTEPSGIFSSASSPALQAIYYQYFLLKVFELLDTLFMIARHRVRQITFLHVFHHASMLLLTDFAAELSPWLAMSPVICLNSLVHAFLYLYYGLSGAGIKVPTRWRRHLTQLQIGQFAIGLVYSFWGYWRHGFCVYSIVYGVTLTALFSHFYWVAYVTRGPARGSARGGHTGPNNQDGTKTGEANESVKTEMNSLEQTNGLVQT